MTAGFPPRWPEEEHARRFETPASPSRLSPFDEVSNGLPLLAGGLQRKAVGDGGKVEPAGREPLIMHFRRFEVLEVAELVVVVRRLQLVAHLNACSGQDVADV